MKRKFRLRDNAQFQSVRREGRSWIHSLIVLYARPNDLGHSRFGFSVSKRIGRAVVRNRAKRLMREATRLRQEAITDGWDVVFIARGPIRTADYHQVDRAVEQLLRRARLLKAADQVVPTPLPTNPGANSRESLS